MSHRCDVIYVGNGVRTMLCHLNDKDVTCFTVLAKRTWEYDIKMDFMGLLCGTGEGNLVTQN